MKLQLKGGHFERVDEIQQELQNVLLRFEKRTYSSGNGAGIDVTLHKGAILKGILPKHRSSKYILVYRASLRTY
jgi:hypothetical protein